MRADRASRRVGSFVGLAGVIFNLLIPRSLLRGGSYAAQQGGIFDGGLSCLERGGETHAGGEMKI